jgi:di/tricarboxylate transporter
MTRPRTVGLYRNVLWLYPRSFRDEYGDDMVQLLVEQLRHEGRSRVWCRLAVDLVLTVPARRLEAHTNRPSSSAVTALYALVALAGVVVFLVGGTSVAASVVGGVVTVVAGGLAIVSARRSRTLTRGSVTAHWWKFLVGGAAALAALVVVTTITGELPEGGWFLAMAVLLASLASVLTGLLLGVVRLGTGRPAAS